MQYHIQTTPIWDAFRAHDGCPICTLYARTEARVLKSFSSDAVMEPEARVKVNKRGFCPEHITKLYAGENKLGLSLQLSTRTQSLIEHMKSPTDRKSAQKEAARIRASLSTCVICDSIDELIARYAYTVAQMYLCEPEFPAVFAECDGFCFEHYALLLEHAHRAGKATSDYLAALAQVQRETLSRVVADLDAFSAQYDYRAARAVGSARDALPRAVEKFTGK